MTDSKNESTPDSPAGALENERQRRPSWGRIVDARIDAVLAVAGSRVLDVGCSGGAYVRRLCENGFDAYGIDVLEDERWEGPYRDRFERADAGSLPFDDQSFDTVISFEVLEHTDDADRVVQEYFRVARKNIVISVPDCSTPDEMRRSGLTYFHWVDPTHRQAFTEESIRTTLESNGFEIKTIGHINPVHPQLLDLLAWRIPPPVAVILSRCIAAIPWYRKYFMTLLVVADRKQGGTA